MGGARRFQSWVHVSMGSSLGRSYDCWVVEWRGLHTIISNISSPPPRGTTPDSESQRQFSHSCLVLQAKLLHKKPQNVRLYVYTVAVPVERTKRSFCCVTNHKQCVQLLHEQMETLPDIKAVTSTLIRVIFSLPHHLGAIFEQISWNRNIDYRGEYIIDDRTNVPMTRVLCQMSPKNVLGEV